MAYEDKFRMSVHAVILNHKNEVLLLKANYADKSWGLPGGSLEPSETVHEALRRECIEEIGCQPQIKELTGIYYHPHYSSQVLLFRCEIEKNCKITLSSEHSGYKYTPINDLTPIQKIRIQDAINYNRHVISRKF